MSPTARSEQQSVRRPVRALLGRGRAARSPLPILVTALAVLGGCAIVLPLVGMGTRVSWGQLPQLLATPSAQAALWLSIRTCLSSTVVCVVLGVPLALLLARSWPGVRIARILAVLPMTMPPVVAGIALLSTLGNRGLLGAHLKEWGVPIAFSTTAVVIAQVFVSMPFLVVTLEAALRSRDKRAEVTARSLGAGPWRVLAQVTLPLATPALARGTALALGRSLGEFGATIAFAGSKEGVTRTMPLAIYLEREKDTATSLALAALLIGLSFVIVGATNIDWGRVATHLLPRHRRQEHQDHDVAVSEPRGAQVSTPSRGERTSESPRGRSATSSLTWRWRRGARRRSSAPTARASRRSAPWWPACWTPRTGRSCWADESWTAPGASCGRGGARWRCSARSRASSPTCRCWAMWCSRCAARG